MTDKKTRARIRELHACAVGWAARAMREADEGKREKSAKTMRRANEYRSKAYELEAALRA